MLGRVLVLVEEEEDVREMLLLLLRVVRSVLSATLRFYLFLLSTFLNIHVYFYLKKKKSSFKLCLVRMEAFSFLFLHLL